VNGAVATELSARSMSVSKRMRIRLVVGAHHGGSLPDDDYMIYMSLRVLKA
jgi:hypothetical protein